MRKHAILPELISVPVPDRVVDVFWFRVGLGLIAFAKIRMRSHKI
jgi:hypothetical protein